MRLRRPGFTLVEMLVVMAIIAILASLLLVAVMKAWKVVPDVQTRADITGLQTGLSAFKAYYKVNYVPSKLRLAKLSANSNAETVAFVTRVWPTAIATWQSPGIDWVTPVDNGPTDLQGDQVLVLLLGGPQVNNVPVGWSSNPSNPAEVTTTTNRKMFYEFAPARLRKRTGAKYLSYYDPYALPKSDGTLDGVPYAFFSSNGSTNGYTNDCDGVLDKDGKYVRPYGSVGATGIPSFMNPDSFQILCAGMDRKWGQGWASWTPQTALTTYPGRNPGVDDLSNFHVGKLGSR